MKYIVIQSFFVQLKATQLAKTFGTILLIGLMNACGNSSESAMDQEKNEATTSTSKPETTAAPKSAVTVSLTADQYRVAGIEMGHLETRSLSGVLQVNGVLDVPPQSLVTVSAPLGGFVRNTNLLPGVRVTKGQVIAVIENQEFIQLQQDYLDTKNKLEYASQELARQQELRKENVNAAKVLQQTEAEYKNLRSRLSALSERLLMIGIAPKNVQDGNIHRSVSTYAPITGYVTRVNVNIGKFVTPTDVLFEIVDTGHLHAELTVFEKDISQVHKGQKVRFSLPNESGRERQATVFLTGKEISSERTVHVHAHLNTEDLELLPKMYIKAVIETSGRPVPSLPDQAIVHSEGKDYVFVDQESHSNDSGQTAHHFSMVPVGKGISENGFTEVVLPENISPSASIVIKGAYTLLATLKNTEEEE
jgi:cobalt-zinc-cadmium efflux system membrane fusion protein